MFLANVRYGSQPAIIDSTPALTGITSVTKICVTKPSQYVYITSVYGRRGGGRGVQPILKHENVRHVSFLNPAAPCALIMLFNICAQHPLHRKFQSFMQLDPQELNISLRWLYNSPHSLSQTPAHLPVAKQSFFAYLTYIPFLPTQIPPPPSHPSSLICQRLTPLDHLWVLTIKLCV